MAGNRATAGHGSSEVRRSREARGTRKDDGRPGPPRLAGPWRPSGPRTCRPSFQPPHNSPRRSSRGGTAPTRGAGASLSGAGAAPRGSARSTRLRRSGEVERDQGREAKGVRDRASAPSPPATGSRDEETETSRRRRGPRKKNIKKYAVVATRARPEELHAVGLDLRAPRLVRRRRSRRKKTRAASTVTRRSATIGRVAMASSRFLNCWGRAAHCAQTEQPKTCGDSSVRAAVAPTTRIQRTPRPRDQAREPALAAAVGPRRAGQRLGEPARVER